MDKKVIEMEIGTLEIYDNSIAAITINNRDVITKEDVQLVLKSCNNNCPGDYILLSNRKSSYSIDPINLYEILGNEKRLIAAGVISYRTSTAKLYPVEDEISEEVTAHNIDLHLFSTLDEGLLWAKKRIEDLRI